MVGDTLPDLEIDDPDEYSQKQRVKELLHRRREVLEARNLAKDEQLLGDVTEEEAIAHYHSRVQTLILDLHTKLKNMEADAVNGRKYLKEKEIDTIEIPPPDSLMAASENDIAAGAEYPDSKTARITGLNWFIENEPYVVRSFTLQTWNPPGERTETNYRVVPIKTLDKALLTCAEFMDEMGVDAQLTAGDYEGGDEPGL